jgi:hypothetical protein
LIVFGGPTRLSKNLIFGQSARWKDGQVPDFHSECGWLG